MTDKNIKGAPIINHQEIYIKNSYNGNNQKGKTGVVVNKGKEAEK